MSFHFAFALMLLGALARPQAARAYIEAPYPLGRLVAESTNIVVIRVEKLDKEKNLIVYRKVRDIKGTHPGEEIKHNIGQAGFHPREWQTIMAWAEVGKTALFFHNGGAGETCIDGYWYQIYAGEWWRMSHGEPYLLRSFAGRPEKLAVAVANMLTGQEVVVPCMVDGDKNALQLRTAKLQRMKAGLKIVDYNAPRDFVGWGAEEYRPIAGMPGFTHIASLAALGASAGGAAAADYNGDGKVDLCLFGAWRAALFANDGGILNEASPVADGGARAAAWGKLDGDGGPALLLATPAGPKLLAWKDKAFDDITSALPRQPYYNLTAAAWIDVDGDGRQDILLADGFRGLRLWRQLDAKAVADKLAGLGPWYVASPFDNPGGAGFAAVYPPEKGVDLAATYSGKGGAKVAWKKADFKDGQVNNLLLFGPPGNEAAAAYVYREISVAEAGELPVSLGSDDTLTVWLNGKRLLAENVARGCAPDQARLTLKLRPGPNKLLMKICQGGGDFAFYFAAGKALPKSPQRFEDVSDRVGLGTAGVAGDLKGDHLAVADVNGDGRPDVLYSAGAGVLAINTPGGFRRAADCGISYRPGGVAPVFGDFNGDGRADLFVPQPDASKLFANAGGGRFTDVTAASGALAEPIGRATCAAWADLDKTGRAGLLVGCLKGPNRYFRNNGDGTFSDATAAIGLDRQVFNTRGIAVVDVNGDGAPDVVFNNDRLESVVLLGRRVESGEVKP